MKKLLLLFVVVMVGCSAKYVIPPGRTMNDFKIAVKECQDKCGTKRDIVYFGDVGALMGIGNDIHNIIVETRFRNCMEEKGYKVAE